MYEFYVSPRDLGGPASLWTNWTHGCFLIVERIMWWILSICSVAIFTLDGNCRMALWGSWTILLGLSIKWLLAGFV